MMAAAIRSMDLTSAERKRRARERLITLTRLMDSAVEVPLLRTRVGLDALLGAVPVAGDLLSAAIGVYLITQARELGASRWLQGKMIGNLVVDVEGMRLHLGGVEAVPERSVAPQSLGEVEVPQPLEAPPPAVYLAFGHADCPCPSLSPLSKLSLSTSRRRETFPVSVRSSSLTAWMRAGTL